MEKGKPILCVDFDGVISNYESGWLGATTIPDPPVPGALQFLWRATEIFSVQVYSSRSKTQAGRDAMRYWMIKWSFREFCGTQWYDPECKHPMCVDDPSHYPIGFPDAKPAARVSIDDRALTFKGDWNEFEPADLIDFQPWNKGGRSYLDTRPAPTIKVKPLEWIDEPDCWTTKAFGDWIMVLRMRDGRFGIEGLSPDGKVISTYYSFDTLEEAKAFVEKASAALILSQVELEWS